MYCACGLHLNLNSQLICPSVLIFWPFKMQILEFDSFVPENFIKFMAFLLHVEISIEYRFLLFYFYFWFLKMNFLRATNNFLIFKHFKYFAIWTGFIKLKKKIILHIIHIFWVLAKGLMTKLRFFGFFSLLCGVALFIDV